MMYRLPREAEGRKDQGTNTDTNRTMLHAQLDYGIGNRLWAWKEEADSST